MPLWQVIRFSIRLPNRQAMPPISIRVVRVIRWLPWKPVRYAQGGSQFALRSFLAVRSGCRLRMRAWVAPYSIREVRSPPGQSTLISTPPHPLPAIGTSRHFSASRRAPAPFPRAFRLTPTHRHRSLARYYLYCIPSPCLHWRLSSPVPRVRAAAPLLLEAWAGGAGLCARRSPRRRSRSGGRPRFLAAFESHL